MQRSQDPIYLNPLRGHLPHGVQDQLPGDVLRRRRAEVSLRELYSAWAYREVVPPTIEYEDNLIIGASPELKRAMYRLFDRDGQTLGLRTDFTTQIARVAATKMLADPLPLRCFYMGSVFRREEPQAGRQREFTQCGIELLGASTLEADAEVVALAAASLEALGISGYQINLSQTALFRGLTANFPAEAAVRVSEAIDRRSASELEQVLRMTDGPSAEKNLIRRLPELIGGPEVLEPALAIGGNVADAAAALARVYDLLDGFGIADRVILDLGEVRGMDYYTGITFRGVAPGLGWPLISGGRYDELVGQFGRPLAAVGFGLGLERALLAAPPSSDAGLSPPVVVASPCPDRESMSLLDELRNRSYVVDVDVLGRDLPGLIDYAGSIDAQRVVAYCGISDEWTVWSDGRTATMSAGELLLEMESGTRGAH